MAVSAWTKHLKTQEEKDQYIQSLHRVDWVLKHVKQLILSSSDSIESVEISPKSYDSPNWAYRQAHSNGYRQALKDFTKLLTLDQEETNGRQPTGHGSVRPRNPSE
jgi:hypothetical protein